MKKLSLLFSKVFVFLALFLAMPFSMGGVSVSEDIKNFPDCLYCGMNRDTFGYTRMLITYENGNVSGICSLHCAVIDMALKTGSPITRIMVGDYNNRNLIDAESAHWVIGGNKAGVMSMRAKWAFETDLGADAFIKENGGTKVAFDTAVRTAFEDMYDDIQMIREKRKLRHS